MESLVKASMMATHTVSPQPARPHWDETVVSAMQAEAAGAAWQQEPTLLLCGDLNSDRNDGMPGEHQLRSPALAGMLTSPNLATEQTILHLQRPNAVVGICHASWLCMLLDI